MTKVRHRVGIIGAGVIADFHAQALQAIDGVELVAAFAEIRERQKLCQKYGCTGYSDLDQFLGHQGMNVVTVGSVSGVHLEHVRAAARAGKHVIVKSHLRSTDRVDEMIRLCEEEGVILSGIFPRRFNDSTSIFKEAITSGRPVKWFYVIPIKWWRTQNIMTVVHGGEPGN